MESKKAVGLIEVDGVCAAFAAVDAASKAGNITVESIERTRQGCNVCIKVKGDVSSVKASMEAAEKVNKSGNIQTGNQSTSNTVKEDRKNNPTNVLPKISKEDMENEIVRIMKLNDPYLNFTANANLTYLEEKPVYIVDVYDDYGWYGYFEVDGEFLWKVCLDFLH